MLTPVGTDWRRVTCTFPLVPDSGWTAHQAKECDGRACYEFLGRNREAKTVCKVGKGSETNVRHCFGEGFVILDQSARATRLGKTELHHPATRLQDEAPYRLRFDRLHDHQCAAAGRHHRGNALVVTATFPGVPGPVRWRGDSQGQQLAECIRDRVSPLRSIDAPLLPFRNSSGGRM